MAPKKRRKPDAKDVKSNETTEKKAVKQTEAAAAAAETANAKDHALCREAAKRLEAAILAINVLRKRASEIHDDDDTGSYLYDAGICADCYAFLDDGCVCECVMPRCINRAGGLCDGCHVNICDECNTGASGVKRLCKFCKLSRETSGEE